MDYKLTQFDILCQQILNQKKHGFLHNLRPFARKRRYIQEDFLDLWYKSGFKKLQYALTGADFNFNFTQIDVPNGERDIYQGTDRPGIILRYKINANDQQYVIEQLLYRLKENSPKDDMAQWRTYLQLQLQDAIKSKTKFHLNMELQVIGRIIPKSGQSFQNKKAEQISQFNSGGFKGNIYIWFDLQKYKDEISARLKEQGEKQKEHVYNPVTQQIDYEPQNTDDETENIHLTAKQQDKIKIASFQMIIKDSDKEGLVGIAKRFVQGDINEYLGNSIVAGINRIRGIGKQKDNSQDPDIIKRKSTLFDLSKPFVQVISTVTLQDWLYNASESPERKYMGSNDKKTNESSLSKYPFEYSKLKEAANPQNDFDLNSSSCWSAGTQVDKWHKVAIDKAWLQDTSITQHFLSFRFQSWIKSQDGYYFEYRFILNIQPYYIARRNTTGTPITFKTWLQQYFKQMDAYRPDPTYKIQIDKHIYNSQNKLVNKDGHIRGSLQALKQRDYAAAKYFEDFFKHNLNKLTVNGESLENIMDSI